MTNKIVTYSLLAHINESNALSTNYENLFAPLVKRVLAIMSQGQKFEGAEIAEIKDVIDKSYGWDIPPATLKKLLQQIETEVNKEGDPVVMKVYGDGSFQIKPFVFDEFDEEIEKRNKDLKALENIYLDFLKSEGLETEVSTQSIYDFVEQSKMSLGKYINKKYAYTTKDNTIEARFVSFISSIPKLYSIFQSIYIGSIISTYLEYIPEYVTKKDVELLLDTNFVISLLDLNTAQSTDNCVKLLDLAQKIGYNFSILEITLREIDGLLSNRIDYFDTSFFSSLVDPEDIYNACRRRGISKTDLQRIRANVEKEMSRFNISIVHNIQKFENRAKFSTEYESLKTHRNSSFAALHDATCIDYVKTKRGRSIHDFSKVNCWFVNNSSNRHSYSGTNGNQPYMIKAEDLLNMLWLSSPRIKKELSVSEIARIGLSRLVASTLNDALPMQKIIKELDHNIAKYAKEDISDEDILRVAHSIGRRSFTNVSELVELAETEKREFVQKLHEIAAEQKAKEEERVTLLNRVVEQFSAETNAVKEERKRISSTEENLKATTFINGNLAEQIRKERLKRIEITNKFITEKRALYEKKIIRGWRLKSVLLFIAAISIPFIVVFIVWLAEPENQGAFTTVWNYCSATNWRLFLTSIGYLLLSGFFIANCTLTFFNHSNINAFKSKIVYPQELQFEKEDQD